MGEGGLGDHHHLGPEVSGAGAPVPSQGNPGVSEGGLVRHPKEEGPAGSTSQGSTPVPAWQAGAGLPTASQGQTALVRAICGFGELLNKKREREASGSTTTSAPRSQEQEHRFPARDIRETQKGGWSTTPRKKVQLDPPPKAAPQSQRGRQGLGYQPPARDKRPSSGPSVGSGSSRAGEGSQSSSSRRDPSHRDSGERHVRSST